MAILRQERHSEYASGVEELFVITSTMTSATIPAQLPHLFVFVLKIVTRDDPKDDTLARVARIADLTTLPQGRAAGLASAPGTGVEYLATSCRVTYPTLNEALDAKTAIKDRVNALINDWINFQANFNAPDPTPDNITLPTVDPSQVQALIAAYRAAKQDRYNKGLAKTAADDTLTLANTNYTNASSAVSATQGFVTQATTVSTEMTTAAAAFSSLKTAGDTFLAAAGCAAPVDQANFQAALGVAATQIIANTGYLADAAALASGLSSYVNGTLIPAKTAAATALTTAQAAQITAAQQYTAAQATETAALNAVLAVCPDFDSTTVCTVPG